MTLFERRREINDWSIIKDMPPNLNNTTIAFADMPADSRINGDVNMEIDSSNVSAIITSPKQVGRPKNSKLSALAAKRGGKQRKSVNEITADCTSRNIGKSDDTMGRKSENIALDIKMSPKNGLSSSEKIAIRQNLSHLASQARAGDNSNTNMCANDLIPLTNGLCCDQISVEEILRKNTKSFSQGFNILFPGRHTCNRELYTRKSLYPREYTKSSFTDNSLLLTPGITIERFDFSTCPETDIQMALKKEFESNKRKKNAKGCLKRLTNPSKPVPKNGVKKSLEKDVLTIRRLLKNRVKKHESKITRVAIIGPQSSGKSSILGQLINVLDCDTYKKLVSKFKWDAQKRGRPHDYNAWFIDELEGERVYGRSRDVGEVFLMLPSGKNIHLVDCPGDFDKPIQNVDVISYADEIILVVDCMSVCESDPTVTRYILDFMRLLMHGKRINNNTELVVVLNKMDQCSWLKSAVKKCGKVITAIKDKVHGLENLKIRLLPISARAAMGISNTVDTDASTKDEQYICQTSLIDVLETLTSDNLVNSEPESFDCQPVVVVVNDIYENMGAGFTAVVQVKNGILSPGQSLTCLPSNVIVQIRTVQVVNNGKLVTVPAAVKGELVHVVLWHADINSVSRGAIICETVLSSSINDISVQPNCVSTSQNWIAIIHIHSLNGRSIIPGRQVLFRSFSSTSPAFICNLLWTCNSKDVIEKYYCKTLTRTSQYFDGTCLRSKPTVVSSENVLMGVEVSLETSHSCILDSSVNCDFVLFDGRELLATGSLIKKSSNTNNEYEDPFQRTFHRSFDLEEADMDVDDVS